MFAGTLLPEYYRPRRSDADHQGNDGHRQGQYDQPELTHRWWIQDDPAGRELLLRLTAVVAPLVGRPIKPSYCFACRYFDEAKLPCHVDREQCEYSITLLLAGPSSWPLTLHAPEGPVDIHQRPGDALAYLGRRLPHERPPLPPGATSLHLFLHWVDEGFVTGWAAPQSLTRRPRAPGSSGTLCRVSTMSRAKRATAT